MFDRDGKAKNLICRKGDGPEEYNVIQRVDVDWQRGEVYVLGSPTKVYVYAFDGTYKQTLDTKANIRQGICLTFRPINLFCLRKRPMSGKEGE